MNTIKCQKQTPWPAVIFAIVAILILIAIILSNKISKDIKSMSFFVFLIISLIIFGILIFLSKSGQHAAAWFVLLLPIAIWIFGTISIFLATATTEKECIVGNIR